MPKEMKGAMNSQKYKKIFEYFNYVLERKLSAPLPFNVELDFCIIEDLRKYLEESDYSTLLNSIGTYMFLLIYDVNHKRILGRYEDFFKAYLNKSDLKNLKNFYEEYHTIIDWCIKNDYSSLYLYDTIYKKTIASNVLGNVYDAFFNSDDAKTRLFCSKIIIQFLCLESHTSSEKTRENLYYQMHNINSKFDMFTPEMVDKFFDTYIEELNEQLCEINLVKKN